MILLFSGVSTDSESQKLMNLFDPLDSISKVKCMIGVWVSNYPIY